MNETVFLVIVSLCESAVSGVIFLNLLNKKNNKYLLLLLWCEIVVGLSVLCSEFSMIVKFVMIMIAEALFIQLGFNDENKKQIVFIVENGIKLLSILSSLVLFNVITANTIHFSNTSKTFNWMYIIMYLIVYSFLMSVLFQFVRKERGVELFWIIGTQIIIGVAECAAVLSIAKNHTGSINGQDSLMIVIAAVCMVCSNMSVGLLAPYLIRQYSMLKNIDYGKELSGMEYKYYEISVENEKKIREMRHDISNCIQTVYALLKCGESEKSLEIINELMNSYAQVEQMLFCENPVVNVILANKRAEACNHGIDIQITVENSLNNVSITDFDLSTIICNLIDNAIRGCICSEQSYPKIIIEILRKGNYLVIKVINSCKIELNIENTDRIDTTKSNSQAHGFGMPIISSVAKRYRGDFIVSAQNGIFTATAVVLLK